MVWLAWFDQAWLHATLMRPEHVQHFVQTGSGLQSKDASLERGGKAIGYGPLIADRQRLPLATHAGDEDVLPAARSPVTTCIPNFASSVRASHRPGTSYSPGVMMPMAGQVAFTRTIVSRAHSDRVWSSEPARRGLMLGGQLWLEGAAAVVQYLDGQFAEPALEDPVAAAVARVAGGAGRRLVLLVTGVPGHFRIRSLVDRQPGQLLGQAVLANQAFRLLLVGKRAAIGRPSGDMAGSRGDPGFGGCLSPMGLGLRAEAWRCGRGPVR